MYCIFVGIIFRLEELSHERVSFGSEQKCYSMYDYPLSAFSYIDTKETVHVFKNTQVFVFLYKRCIAFLLVLFLDWRN